MDKQILYQYIDACELIKETEEEIRRIKRQRKRIEHDVVKGSSHDFPYTPTNFHVEGVGYSVIRDPQSGDPREGFKAAKGRRGGNQAPGGGMAGDGTASDAEDHSVQSI